MNISLSSPRRAFFLAINGATMPADSTNFATYGLEGLVIFSLFALIIFLVNEHKAERKEWIDAYRDIGKLSDDRQKETNEVIRELVTVVQVSNERTRRTDHP
jgi:hypothetical protein